MFGKTSVCLLLAAASTLVAAKNSTTNSTTPNTASNSDWQSTQDILDAWNVFDAGLNDPDNAPSNSTGTDHPGGSLVNLPGSNGALSSLNSTSSDALVPGLNETIFDPLTNSTMDPSKPKVTAVDPRFPPITPCQAGGGQMNSFFRGCGKCLNSSAIAPVPLAKAKLIEFDNSWLVGQDGAGGGKTWWNIPAFAPECKVLIFGETPAGLAPPHGLPGVTSVVASTEGCYYSNTGSKIAVSFCCGNDECSSVSQGLLAAAPPPDRESTRRSIGSKEVTSIPTRRSIPYSPTAMTEVVQKRDDPIYTFFTPANTYSATSNWVAPEVPQEWCEPAVELDSNKEYAAAGAQQFTGNILKCPPGTFCSESVEVSVTSGNSLETEGSSTDTDSHGMNWSGTFGWSWGVTATATIGGDKSWSNAISNSTAYTNTSSLTQGLTASLGIEPGTYAQLALVPQMTCKVLQSTCHNGTNTAKVNSQLCSQVYAADGKTPQYISFPVTVGTA